MGNLGEIQLRFIIQGELFYAVLQISSKKLRVHVVKIRSYDNERVMKKKSSFRFSIFMLNHGYQCQLQRKGFFSSEIGNREEIKKEEDKLSLMQFSNFFDAFIFEAHFGPKDHGIAMMKALFRFFIIQ